MTSVRLLCRVLNIYSLVLMSHEVHSRYQTMYKNHGSRIRQQSALTEQNKEQGIRE